MNTPVTDSELAAKAVAPRVSLADIEGSIAAEHYFTAAEGELGKRYAHNEDEFGVPQDLELLMFCVLVLKNGFTVVGKSACADPKNFNREIGERVARENAVREIWPLLGYELKSIIWVANH